MKVGPHPDADSLYVEEIDLGEGQPRQVEISFKSLICTPHAVASQCALAWIPAGSHTEAKQVAVLVVSASVVS